MLSKLLSGGAAELVKGVGGVIDSLNTSSDEKLEAEFIENIFDLFISAIIHFGVDTAIEDKSNAKK